MKKLIVLLMSIFICGYANAATLTAGNVPSVNTGGATPKLQNSVVWTDGTNVGVGSTNPGTKLDVVGTGRFTAVQVGTGSSVLYGDSNGNVGIGSAVPNSTLDVVGTVKATGLQITTNPSAGYVLTSSSVGIATWMPSGGGVSGVTTSYIPKAQSSTALSDSVMFQAGSNIGVGSTNPGTVLDVSGAIRSTGAGNSLIGGNLGIGTTVGVPNALYVVGTPMFTAGLNIGIGTASPTRLCIANGAIATCAP